MKKELPMRLLKFDTINPEKYILRKIKDNASEISSMSRKQMLDWIISLRGNFSDFYTYHLRNLGWEAEEFIVSEPYLEKVIDELYGATKGIIHLKDDILNKLRPFKDRWKLNVIKDYINNYKPDVILIREQIGIPSDYWHGFRNKSLIVSRIATPVPRYWSHTDFDLILTSTEVFRTFFELNRVPSYINHNGFDERVLSELKQGEKKYNTTFVGGLGDKFWINRTKCFRFLAMNTDAVWWGYNEEIFPETDVLRQKHKGLASGLEMLQIYKDSRIVFNDYGEIADGMGVNQRIFEVLGVGSFLLTRKADNLSKTFPKDIFGTFTDEKDCLDKINYYLKNEAEREEMAKAGQDFIIKNYNYKELMKEIDTILRQNYKLKFKRNIS
jgi:hypothetical protein